MKKKPFVFISLLALWASFCDMAYAQPLPCDSFLSQNTHPIANFKTDQTNAYFQSLKAMIGQSKIVALGETTRGTHEIYQSKHQLIRFLIEEMDFRTIALESSLPETQALNEYIQGGKGKITGLLRNLRIRTWHNVEMLALIEYLREYNQQNGNKIQVIGFDMQMHRQILQDLDAFIDEHAPSLSEIMQIIKEEYAEDEKLRNYNKLQPKTEALYQALRENRSQYARGISSDKYDWVLHEANILAQNAGWLLDHKNAMSRDKSMADNIQWLEKYWSNGKVIVWSHNTHIDQLPFYAMGSLLEEWYQDDYFTLAFALAEGKYAAVLEDNTLSEENELETPYDKTFEFYLKHIYHPNFLLDMKSVGKSNCKWLKNKLKFRDLDNSLPGKEFVKTDLIGSFDALIFFRESTAVEVIPW